MQKQSNQNESSPTPNLNHNDGRQKGQIILMTGNNLLLDNKCWGEEDKDCFIFIFFHLIVGRAIKRAI